MKQRGFAFILIVIIIAIVGVMGLFFSSNKTIDNLPSPTDNLPRLTPGVIVGSIEKTTDSEWSKYTNTQGKFSILFPEKLQVYEKINEPGSAVTGEIYFCEDQPVRSNSKCVTGGLVIFYGVPFIDGKGSGPCDGYDFTILNTKKYACDDGSYLRLQYFTHPAGDSEVDFLAHYSDNFSRDDTHKMLYSFKFIN